MEYTVIPMFYGIACVQYKNAKKDESMASKAITYPTSFILVIRRHNGVRKK